MTRSTAALVLSCLCLLLAACAIGGGEITAAARDPSEATPGPEKKGNAVKVAILLPLSGQGQTAVVAKALKQAAEMALFELDNPSFQLVTKDDKGTPEGARAAAEEALKEGAEMLIGPLFAKSVQAIAPLARQANVPVLAFSNDRQVAGQGVYLLGFLPQQEVDRVVSYAAAQGKQRFAALVSDDAYGKLAETAFREAVTRAGGTIAALETYETQSNRMVEPAQRVVAAIRQAEEAQQPVEALFVPGGPETLPSLGPLLSYANLDTDKVKLLGTGGWDYPTIGREAPFVGGWYSSADPRGWRGFSERFAKTFGASPPRLASMAFDAATVAISLSGNPPGQRYTAANLTRANGFSGVDGPVRLLPNGLAERGLAILEVQKFGSRVVDTAATGFATSDQSAGGFRFNFN